MLRQYDRSWLQDENHGTNAGDTDMELKRMSVKKKRKTREMQGVWEERKHEERMEILTNRGNK